MKKAVAVILSVVLIAFCGMPCFAVNSGTTYYIDSENGDDLNSGLSESNAWKTVEKACAMTYSAGDSILFKAGGTFSGNFTAKGNGTENEPVTVGAYGDTENDGLPVLRNNDSSVLMTVKNVSYWTVENIEFTSPDGSGICVNADNGNQVYDITIKNCVFCDICNKQYASGRPITLASNGKTARLNNITIKDCNIYDCGYGIAMSGLSREWTPDDYVSPEESYNKNYVIDGVSLNNILYDGIIIMSVCGMVIKNCSLLNTCLLDDHYTAPMWSHHADSFIIENCEIAGSLNEKDGMSVDFDGWTTNSVYQYIYSHDNVRFIANCCYDNYTKNDNCTVRYCLSVNDNKGSNNMAQLLTAGGHDYDEDEYCTYMDNFKFYNNTIVNFSEFNLIGLKNAYIANNIFVGRDIASCFRFARKEKENNKSVIREFEGVFTNNCFRSCAIPQISENTYTCNPEFIGSDLTDKDSFKLCKSSGLIGSGVYVENAGEYDLYGNEIGDSVNIGCYGGEGEDVTYNVNIFDEIKSFVISALSTIYNFIYTCNDKYWIF